MKTIRQVAALAGVSVRTLQYYDTIGLLKPSDSTASGYRLYDDDALERLRQILFYRELDFKLSEIKALMQSPRDKAEVYRQQKELLCFKRDRLNRLIELLDRLESGEPSISFQAFDLSEYVELLERFRQDNTDEIIRHWGSVEHFDRFLQKVRDSESEVAKLAIRQYGSIEKYTQAMRHNLENFSELMEKAQSAAENKDEIMRQSDALYRKLTADMTRDAAAPEIQETVCEIKAFLRITNLGLDMGEGFWGMVIESYSDDTVSRFTDVKYGEGASAYIASAFRHYFYGAAR